MVLLWLATKFIALVMKLFFKEIALIGKESVPKEGALILCGNHSNLFVDPMLILS